MTHTLSASQLSPQLAQNMHQLDIRHETAVDADWVEHLHQICFGPGRFARAAFRIRERFGVDENLSFVAEHEGVSVANVKMSPINLSGMNGYLLGPLVTDPHRRRMGAGRLLTLHVTQKALEQPGCKFVLLVGDRAYYEPLGFEPISPQKIDFPAPVDPMRVLAVVKSAKVKKGLTGPISFWSGDK
jgi:predicted N-acetyltransferase YhbS